MERRQVCRTNLTSAVPRDRQQERQLALYCVTDRKYSGKSFFVSRKDFDDRPSIRNVLLTARATHLPKDSVANVSQIVALDKSILTERVGKLSPANVDLLLSGIDVVLGR